MKQNPKIYRLLSICRTPHAEGGQQVTAKLYHQSETRMVDWWCQKTDTALMIGTLVTVEGKLFEINAQRVMVLGQIIPVNSTNPDVNLFETIPPNWHVEDRVRDQAAKLWTALPLAHRRIFNQIFWGRERFHRYVTERRCGESVNSLTHLAWVVRATHEQLNRAVSDRATGLADLILNGLLMDAGSLEGPAPQSYVRLLEWLLLAHREMPQLDDDLMPRLAWQVLQVHGLIERPRTELAGNELVVDRDCQ